MNNLERQPGERFHVWARRIRDRYQKDLCREVPYPKSIAWVNEYIEKIRNGRKCYDCGEYIIAGYYNYLSIELQWSRHQEYCFLHPKRENASITFQQAWRIRKFTRNRKIRFLQKKILEWLYRPGGLIMKKFEKHFHELSLTLR